MRRAHHFHRDKDGGHASLCPPYETQTKIPAPRPSEPGLSRVVSPRDQVERPPPVPPPQGATLNSTRRSSASLASSLPVPTIISREPLPVETSRPRSDFCSSSSRSLIAGRPVALVWPTTSRQPCLAAVRSATFSIQAS